MRETKLVVLSVHYKYPELVDDQARRIERCSGPARQAMGLRLEYFPVVHALSTPAVVAAAEAACRGVPGAGCLDVCARLGDLRRDPCLLHGESLAAAVAELSAGGRLAPDDLLVILDHDTHPLAAFAFAALARRLVDRGLSGIGIPQWHRGHCYLHPSLLMTRVGTVTEMGAEMAFKANVPAALGQGAWHDTAEGFTLWCERHGRPRQALRVNASRFPWTCWDSAMVPNHGAELIGEHGEPVHVGNLMHYGLEAGRSLVSHMWALTLHHPRRLGLDDDTPRQVFSAYLDEPLLE